MGFSRQEYWSGLPCSPPEDLPDPGMEPASPALAGRFFTTEPPGKPTTLATCILYTQIKMAEDVCNVLCVVTQSCPTLWNPMDCVAHQAPLSMGLSRQEYRSGLPFPPPEDVPYPGIEPASPALAGRFLTTGLPGKFRRCVSSSILS